MDSPADTNRINSDFYSPLLNNLTQRIHFTNGSNDPWSTLSLTPHNPQANNPNLSYTVIEGAAHCEDLHAPSNKDSKSLQEAREKTIALLNMCMH